MSECWTWFYQYYFVQLGAIDYQLQDYFNDSLRLWANLTTAVVAIIVGRVVLQFLGSSYFHRPVEFACFIILEMTYFI